MGKVRAEIEVPLSASEAFDVMTEELVLALRGYGMDVDLGPNGGVRQGGFEVGRIVQWVPGDRMLIEWRQADWNPNEITQVEVRCEPLAEGTRLVVEHRRWGGMIGDARELAGWFVDEVAAPLLRATAPAAFGDWLTDRLARRPAGASARAVYRDPLYHYPNFRVILGELALSRNDYLLEVGCGGGALLKAALRSGCRAAAVDHSADMVRLARAVNPDAVHQGRLEVVEAPADALPFADETFTCAAMTGVLGFLPDPVAAFSEIHRVLARGGRFVGLGSDPELRGTPGAPEPMASRLRFYDDGGLAALGRDAGFRDVRVVRTNLEPFAREAGVPEEHLPIFAGSAARFLLCRKA